MARLQLLALPWLFFVLIAALADQDASQQLSHLRFRRDLQNGALFQRGQNSSAPGIEANSTLTEAQKLVDAAVKQQELYNDYITNNPRRNTYHSHTQSAGQAASHSRRGAAPSAPVLDKKLLKAAALVAEYHASQQSNETVSHNSQSNKFAANADAADDFWVGNIKHTGLAPMGSNSSYPVFRNVKDSKYGGGAKGDGVTDDTDAINAAIAYGNNCGEDCKSSSIKGTLIYFPPGKYLISSPINAYYYSQLVGSASSPPTIVTSRRFIGLGAIQSDVYLPGASGDEWYIEQSNFYRQVRNLDIDISNTHTRKAAGLHWQVAQATSLTNVRIYASKDAGTTQMGMFTENGSGGFMSDVTIDGGQYGIYGGNQQYTVRSFSISGQTEACICLLWDWGWTWSQLTLGLSPVGILLLNAENQDIQQAGSIYVMDSTFLKVDTAIKARALKKTILESSIITLENIHTAEVKQMIAFNDGQVASVPAGDVDFVIVGNVEQHGSEYGVQIVDVPNPAESLLGSTNGAGSVGSRVGYFARSRPQYENLSPGDFVNVKDHGAKGDGVSDDTTAIQSALGMATTSNVIYFPAGSYIITSTITLPTHIRMTGEVWSQLVASGSAFGDMSNPKPMIKVGNPGDSGLVEISDMLFTSVGALPGLIMMEWNIHAEKQGSVGIWDSHFRLGGAYGSELQLSQCPKVTSIPDGCIAASMMMHITPKSNGYFENVWLWIADHDIDDAENTMITVAAGRGLLVESADGPTWLYGTASEHAMLYQYNFYNTTNVFAGMIQTESPYFQAASSTTSPGPFKNSLGKFNNDPTFDDGTCSGSNLICDISWAVMASNTNNLTIAGAGLYSWFDAYDQSVCVDAQNCQQRLFNDQGTNGGLRMFNLITIGAVEMISKTGDFGNSGDAGNSSVSNSILAKDYTQATGHPFWSALAAYEDSDTIRDETCDEDNPAPSCLHPALCDKTKKFSSLDDVEAAAGKVPDICLPYHILTVLNPTLDSTMDRYKTVNEGYDAVYKYYVEYVKGFVPGALNAFMSSGSYNSKPGEGNQYFDCELKLPNGEPQTFACPIDWKMLSSYPEFSITYKLKDEKGFYDKLQSKYNIEKSWVSLDKHVKNHPPKCSGTGGGGGIGNPLRMRCVDQIVQDWYGLPQATDKVNPKNPKDTITKALPTLGDLRKSISNFTMEATMDTWLGSTDALLQVLSMPVLMMSQTVESMQQAKHIALEQQKKDKKALIEKILTIVFLVVPLLGPLAPEAFAADATFEMVSASVNIVLTVKAIIDDPVSAPIDILGALTFGGARAEGDIEKLASERRAIGKDKIVKIGDDFAKLDDKMQGLAHRACKI